MRGCSLSLNIHSSSLSTLLQIIGIVSRMNIQNFAPKALVTKDNSILLIHYSENKYGNENSITGTWGLPGGRIEMGEKPDEAMVREVQEEAGITCKPGRPFYV